MSYIVHSATGAQGSPVVSALTAAGAPVGAITRDRTVRIPGTETVVADMTSVESLIKAYRGAKGVFVHLPAVPGEALRPLARNIVEAMRATTPTRVVISTSGGVVSSSEGETMPAQDTSLSTLITGIADLGISHAVIEPRLFLENLLMPPLIQAVRTQGVLRYPIRADLSVSWASHLDIADAAAALLLERPEITGIVGVGQLPGVTGQNDLAAAYATHLGREMTFESVDPMDFGNAIADVIGEAAAVGVVHLYQRLWEADAHVIETTTSAQQILGLTPRTTEQWLNDIGF